MADRPIFAECGCCPIMQSFSLLAFGPSSLIWWIIWGIWTLFKCDSTAENIQGPSGPENAQKSIQQIDDLRTQMANRSRVASILGFGNLDIRSKQGVFYHLQLSLNQYLVKLTKTPTQSFVKMLIDRARKFCPSLLGKSRISYYWLVFWWTAGISALND